MKIERQDIQGIESISVQGQDPEVAVVLLHGYGANMNDLFPLWELWHRPKFNWYFPNGVMSLNMGGSYYEARAWFSIDIEKFERAVREGKQRDLKDFLPPEFGTTLPRLEAFLGEIGKRHQKIILGGFSQGAMCASHLAMKAGLKVDGLLLLSGALVAQEKMPVESKGLPFYQSHGTKDPILSLEGAKDLEKKLHRLNFSGRLHVFNGGHEIPPSVIQEVKEFLGQFA